MATDELQTDTLEELWEEGRDEGDQIQVIDLELDEYEEWNEIDDRDGRNDVSDYEASLDA